MTCPYKQPALRPPRRYEYIERYYVSRNPQHWVTRAGVRGGFTYEAATLPSDCDFASRDTFYQGAIEALAKAKAKWGGA